MERATPRRARLLGGFCAMTAPLVEVRDLSVTYPAHAHGHAVTALRAISFTLSPGETLGLVGTSGSGKSTLARALLGLAPGASGSIRIGSDEVLGAGAAVLRAVRANAQMVFQDTGETLNPRLRIGETIAEPLIAYQRARGAGLTARVTALLSAVGLDPALAQALPAHLSGGQRQRVAIARALALDPAFVIWDEPVSALDGPVRAGILNLMGDIQRQRGLASLFISHDLAVIRHVADRVAVLDQGRIVEVATRDRLFAAPQHPATRRLIAAMPRQL